MFRTADPIVNSRNDDGRTAVATEVATFIDGLLTRMEFGGSKEGKARSTRYRSMFLSWIQVQLGDTPTLESWQRILDALKNRGKPKQVAPDMTPPAPENMNQQMLGY